MLGTPPPTTLQKYWEVPDFTFTDRLGQPVRREDLRGKVWLADFFYTSCPGPCPMMASRLSALQGQLTGKNNVRLISISLDKKKPREVILSENLPFDDQVVIVIDDVASSGKTLLYAMKPFLEAHPRKIECLVLVGRTHKVFPVHPDYIGLSLSTTLQEHIYVEVEGDEVKGAWLE